MKVTVIITVFNLEKYVEAAIESVLTQTRRPDEIIVVNDGSSDRSLERLNPYAGRITVINNNENEGVLPSMIKALECATTDIISFLDGDDVWHPQKLETVVREFDSGDVMMVTHSYRWIDAVGHELAVQDETHKNLNRIVHQAGSDQSAADRLLKNSILTYKGVWLGSAFVIRRACLQLQRFKEWSEKLEGHHLSHQDQPLAAFLIKENPSMRIVYLPQVLFYYRVYGSNSSGNTLSVEKAIRTLDRSKATLLRTRELVRSIPSCWEELKVQENKIIEIEYLYALYTGKRMVALKYFVHLFRSHWKAINRFKEVKRLLIVMTLGTNNFLKLKKLSS